MLTILRRKVGPIIQCCSNRHQIKLGVDLEKRHGSNDAIGRSKNFAMEIYKSMKTCRALLRRLYHRHVTRHSLDRQRLTIITGCDSGLGYAMALRAAKLGSSVIVGVLNVNGPGARDLAERDGIRVMGLDLRCETSRRLFADGVAAVARDEGLVLHAHVNNAAVMIFGLFDWLKPEQINEQLTINLIGPQLLTRCLVHLLRRDKGRVINVSSHCARSSLPGLSIYASTKAAIDAWTCSLRIEFKNFNGHALTLVPGSFFNESRIMSRQMAHFEEMRMKMSDETVKFYEGYYEDYKRALEPLVGTKRYDEFDNEEILGAFEGALLDKWPCAVYKCEPLHYKIYHTLFKITPTAIRDRLVERFMQMPKFKR